MGAAGGVWSRIGVRPGVTGPSGGTIMAKRSRAGRVSVRATSGDKADDPKEVEFRAAVEKLAGALRRLRRWARKYPDAGGSEQEAYRLRDLRRAGGKRVAPVPARRVRPLPVGRG